MVIDGNFWRGRKVFLTGHTGFKGSWLSLWLQRMGAELTGYALQPPTVPSMFDLASVGDGMTSIIGDVRDGAALMKAIRGAQPEVVIHMAAQPLVRYSYVNPVETYSTNVMGTVHLLEAVRFVDSVRAAIVVTTDKCYDNKEWVWGYRENEPMGGHDPYSNSKGCAELVVSAYRSSYFNVQANVARSVSLASARAGNVIGGGDWASDRLIPDMVRAIATGAPATVRNPRAIRPWQHVLEPLSGYLLLAQRLCEYGGQYAGPWNFGPANEDARPVEWIAEKLCEIWGGGASWELSAEKGPHEANYLKLDCSKALNELGWAGSWKLSTALEKIVEWHKSAISEVDMRAFTLTQIQEFSNSKSILTKEK